MTEFKENLLTHYRSHPEMEIEDAFKFIYQGAFGCEHMVSDAVAVSEYIATEYMECASDSDCVEKLSDGYFRVPLSYLENGLTAKTLGKLFYLSSKKEKGGRECLEKALSDTKELICEGLIKLPLKDFVKKAEEWKNKGYPALHHSEKFRSVYKPHYRVIWSEYIPFLPLLAKIDALLKNGRVILAIDGGSASGKTTLAALLSQIYESTVFHMDDFFLTPEMRTPERLSEVGGNVDRERFDREVMTPLTEGKAVVYRKFDCSVCDFSERITVEPRELVIIEGAYSMHPSLADCYTLSAFLSIGEEKQKVRILKRNSAPMAKRFFNEWIPMENTYFDKTEITKKCDLIIEI